MSWFNKGLLSQISDLKEQIYDLRRERDQYKEKVFELLDSKNASTRPASTLVTKPRGGASQHVISKTFNEAICSCGWGFKSDDPAELQTAVSFHYTEQAVKIKQKGFVPFRAIAELNAEKEAREKEIAS